MLPSNCKLLERKTSRVLHILETQAMGFPPTPIYTCAHTHQKKKKVIAFKFINSWTP